MRYGVAIPHANAFATPEAIRAMARAVEDIGFDSLWVSDHIIVPEGSGYIPEFMDEPLALLAYLAAETRHVKLGTSVLIVPYRDPVFTAKFLSTVDYLSSGRLIVGVGAGWLEQEFDALGVPFAERGARTDEYLRVYRNLWETETSSFEGRFKQYTSMRMFPKKAESRRGTIPL
ncbi:MAG: TIGR03619 family F420-dependent LLM class oxidoreductase, partial [Dehalococcoidia bacterium]